MDLVVFVIAVVMFYGMYKLLAKVSEIDTAPSDVAVVETELQSRSSLPEDSTLRRHFLSHLKSQVESELFPRPTCSTLKRHYDSLVLAEVEKRSFQ